MGVAYPPSTGFNHESDETAKARRIDRRAFIAAAGIGQASTNRSGSVSSASSSDFEIAIR